MKVEVRSTTPRATLQAATEGRPAGLTSSGHAGVAAAIIGAAVKDADKPLTEHTGAYAVPGILEAIGFLWEPNPDLEFWCLVAGFDMRAINRIARERYRRKVAIGRALIAQRDAEVAERERLKAEGLTYHHAGRPKKPITRQRWPAWRAAVQA